jgi:hypothetical protein
MLLRGEDVVFRWRIVVYWLRYFSAEQRKQPGNWSRFLNYIPIRWYFGFDVGVLFNFVEHVVAVDFSLSEIEDLAILRIVAPVGHEDDHGVGM